MPGWRVAVRVVLLVLLALGLAALHAPFSPAAAQSSPGCDDLLGRAPEPDEVPPHPFWETVFFLDELRPRSMVSDGQSLFLLDHDLPQLMRIPLGERQLRTCVLETPAAWDDPAEPAREHTVILLGPRAFYLVATAQGGATTLHRAERFPTAVRGGWRVARELEGQATQGIHAVVQQATLFLLRSGPRYEVDWQPIESETAESLALPGSTIDLGIAQRPAAGVVLSESSIYVFGGSPEGAREVVRIPLRRRAPTEPDPPLTSMPTDRAGTRTRLHGRDVVASAQAVLHGRVAYVVGGNAGDPTIDRTHLPLAGREGDLVWESVPPPPREGGAVIAAAMARGKLWLVRADGRIQTTSISAIQPGHARVNWSRSIRRSRVVRAGYTEDIRLPWTYSGPMDFSDIKVELRASRRHPCVSDSLLRELTARRCEENDPLFASIVAAPSRTVGMSPADQPVAGEDVVLRVTIPSEDPATEFPDVRSAYVAQVSLKSGDRGPICRPGFAEPCVKRVGTSLVLRFAVDKRRPRPIPAARPTR